MKITIREIRKYTDNWEKFCHMYNYDPAKPIPENREHSMTILQMDNFGILNGIFNEANKLAKGEKS